MRVQAEAPSNIALIKYMGKIEPVKIEPVKIEPEKNRPTNSSLSFTLDHLRTRVVIEASSTASDVWSSLDAKGFTRLELSEAGSRRFLEHFAFLKQTLKIPGNYRISSANSFPSDCGLASSASSFAALTKASIELGKQVSVEKDWVESLSPAEQAELSRQGSGSSCRSFMSSFVLWTERGVEPVSLPRPHWLHSVVIVEGEKKDVSSSQAHKRVSQSLLFNGRPQRAEQRLEKLIKVLTLQQWAEAFEICWAEFWDMHALFETSQPSFGYMHPESLWVLNQVRQVWKTQNDGPLVTMDAGANVHLLYREDQAELSRLLHAEFSKQFGVISSFADSSVSEDVK